MRAGSADRTGSGNVRLDAFYNVNTEGLVLPAVAVSGRLEVPTVAAVNGPAIGAGTQLALACDLRVADERATFGVPTPRNGMAVDAWTIRTLQTVAGGGLARRLLIAAEIVDRDVALQHGLADRPGTLGREVTLTVGWGTVSRVDLLPATCGDPQCDADHGYDGTITGDDISLRISADAEGEGSLNQAMSFANALSAVVGRR